MEKTRENLYMTYHYSDKMKVDIMNQHVVKILIAARPEDSINAIAHRTGISYGWTYKWIRELEKIGVFQTTRMHVYLNKDNGFYKKTMAYIKDCFQYDIQFYYEVLALLGINYCFTATDAVFVWTKGGYNISRFKDHYPIFIKVRKTDKKVFEQKCDMLGLSTRKKQGVFYHVSYVDSFSYDFCDEISVDSLKDTIVFMKKHIYNFEPAMEMIREMYGSKIKVTYKEVTTNV
jgi:DNA-binding Lrp family transcriptional regulator